MDGLFGSSKQPKLNQEESSNINRPIANEEMKIIITLQAKNKKTKTKTDTDRFTAKFYYTFEENLQPICRQVKKKKDTGEILPNLLYEASISLPTLKQQEQKQSYRTISLLNIGKNSQQSANKPRMRPHQEEHPPTSSCLSLKCTLGSIYNVNYYRTYI